MVRMEDFDMSVALPSGLDIAAIRRSIEYIERNLPDLLDIYFEQANVFSAVVGIYGTKALDSHSVYEKSRHSHTAQQRFPDLKRRNSPDPPSPDQSLESKASKRPWALQSHYDHPGWYIVWRYLVDVTEGIEPGRPVIIWRVDVAVFKSGRLEVRTEYRQRHWRRSYPHIRAKSCLRIVSRTCAVYRRSDIAIKGGKPIPINGAVVGSRRPGSPRNWHFRLIVATRLRSLQRFAR